MISKDQADELRALIYQLRAADDLNNRFAQGWTNKDAAEVKKEFDDAATGIENFIKSITEK